MKQDGQKEGSNKRIRKNEKREKRQYTGKENVGGKESCPAGQC
jgi:hypothetical protein